MQASLYCCSYNQKACQCSYHRSYKQTTYQCKHSSIVAPTSKPTINASTSLSLHLQANQLSMQATLSMQLQASHLSMQTSLYSCTYKQVTYQCRHPSIAAATSKLQKSLYSCTYKQVTYQCKHPSIAEATSKPLINANSLLSLHTQASHLSM